MKSSIRLKMTLTFTALLIIMIFACWLMNYLFIEGYYQKEKLNILVDSYYEVNLIAGSDQINEENQINSGIEKIEAKNSVNVYLISEKTMTNPDNTHSLPVLSFIYPIEMDINNRNVSKDMLKVNIYNKMIDTLSLYLYGNYGPQNSKTAELLDNESDKYTIYKTFDPEVNSSYIDLVGYLQNDCLINIRTPYGNIKESAILSGRFLAIAGGIVTILGIIILIILSRSFTKPILELAVISDKMAGLDFDNKYVGERKDEIGILGKSLNRLSDNLENTITELKTANIELERDIKVRDKNEEMRKEFLSNVSHELKTPIALIQGYAEGLADNVNDDPENRNYYCDVIIDEAGKMNSIVKKLLTLNEIEFGKQQLCLEHFAINELIDAVAMSIDILAKQKQVTIINHLQETVFVWADPTLIEEVVTNYLSNALNHADGQKLIEIGYTLTENKIRINVFNTGENIPEKDINSIWDKFYKVDKARTREYGGSGIGLSIVKAIMEQHNQRYGVENLPSGVLFWFELDIKNL